VLVTCIMFSQIQPNSAAAVYFPIVPKKIGKIKLKIEARSLYAADAIEKELLVEVWSKLG